MNRANRFLSTGTRRALRSWIEVNIFSLLYPVNDLLETRRRHVYQLFEVGDYAKLTLLLHKRSNEVHNAVKGHLIILFHAGYFG
jgi:hypothetical protein